MDWSRMLAYITRTVDQDLLLRKEYLAAEIRILIKEKVTVSMSHITASKYHRDPYQGFRMNFLTIRDCSGQYSLHSAVRDHNDDTDKRPCGTVGK
jgi:hypothetical protein